MSLNPNRQKLIKNLVFLDIQLLKSTTVQRFWRVRTLNFDGGLDFQEKRHAVTLEVGPRFWDTAAAQRHPRPHAPELG